MRHLYFLVLLGVLAANRANASTPSICDAPLIQDVLVKGSSYQEKRAAESLITSENSSYTKAGISVPGTVAGDFDGRNSNSKSDQWASSQQASESRFMLLRKVSKEAFAAYQTCLQQGKGTRAWLSEAGGTSGGYFLNIRYGAYPNTPSVHVKISIAPEGAAKIPEEIELDGKGSVKSYPIIPSTGTDILIAVAADWETNPDNLLIPRFCAEKSCGHLPDDICGPYKAHLHSSDGNFNIICREPIVSFSLSDNPGPFAGVFTFDGKRTDEKTVRGVLTWENQNCRVPQDVTLTITGDHSFFFQPIQRPPIPLKQMGGGGACSGIEFLWTAWQTDTNIFYTPHGD